ncbi:MAG TPA: mercuric reductase [Stellaceae bacterium]|nr:mercuric reductase [Stellaceae bacterium]
MLLAIGGLAAAFGAAACCALPVLLAGVGLGSTWLIGVAAIAAPHRLSLISAAALCLVAGGAVFAWHRRAIACGACGHRMVTPLVAITMALAAVLAVLGSVFA